jgi:adenosylhomocysteine nucleosidase
VGTLGIITGMVFEADILRAAMRNRAAQNVRVTCSGLGREAARNAAAASVAQGATALLSFGIAAGLDEKLVAGSIIIASYVHDGAKALFSDEAWTARLSAECGNVSAAAPQPIAHANDVLVTPEEKAALRTATGAAAADMESYGIAETALAHGLPFATVRVVADTATDVLPSVAARATTPDGRIKVTTSVFGALTHPSQIPELLRLGRRTQTAKQTLRRLADLGLERRFFFPV